MPSFILETKNNTLMQLLSLDQLTLSKEEEEPNKLSL